MNKTVLSALALLILPSALWAGVGGYRFELTPRANFTWGGVLTSAETGLFNEDVTVQDSGGLGVSFDIPLSSFLQLELLASTQSSELRFDEGLFGPNISVADIDVTYYHVGVLWQGDHRRVSPFFVASAGITELDPQVRHASAEARFSVSLGGGVKVFFDDQEHIGLRLEGRGFWTSITDNSDRRWDHDYYYDDNFTQGQASIGLIVAW